MLNFSHRRLLILVIVTAPLIAGCGSTTAIRPASVTKSGFDGAVYGGTTVELDKQTPGAGVYRIFQQGATGFVPLSAVRSDIEDISTRFCARQNKIVHPIQETTSSAPHILGNFPRVEWLFECNDKPGTASTQDQVAENLSKLERLKKLLDNGTLTQAEFDAEKANILLSR